MRLSANISTLFTARPPVARIEAASRAGFRGVEMQFPYEHEPAALAEAARAAGVEFVLINMPGGDFAAGERGTACIPGREIEFQAGIIRAVTYATALGCRRINCLAGNIPHAADAEECRALLIANLRMAADSFAAEGIELLLEPLNRIDNPSFILDGTKATLDLIAEIGKPNVSLQFDLYHSAMAGEAECAMLAEHSARIAHIQISDHPGRCAPGHGMMDFARIFEVLENIPYDGWVGCEYFAPEPDFSWMENYALRP
jgi:hydroxypyruvate isomerase